MVEAGALRKIWRRVKTYRRRLTIAGLIGIIGVALLTRTLAATYVSHSEAEAGQIAGQASLQSGSGASGGTVVKFGTTGTPPSDDTGRTVQVANSDQLTAAIADARPGDTIQLADGTYSGKLAVGKYSGSFAIVKSGTASAPIKLTGSRNAIIDGGGPSGRYGLYIANASYWNISGITITNASKGVVLDGSSHVVLDAVRVYAVGDEAVHFRAFSSDNLIKNSIIEKTGVKQPQYGEGVYIGSAKSNWGTHSNGNPDKSDRNQVINNTISNTSAENIDVKEGSSGGLISGNRFDGVGMAGENYADSWIDAKGNGYTISDNTAVVSGPAVFQDGFQVHQALAGWGNDNVFRNNKMDLNNAPGYGFYLQKGVTGNILKCDNIVTGAKSGFAVLNTSAVTCNP